MGLSLRRKSLRKSRGAFGCTDDLSIRHVGSSDPQDALDELDQ
jgi:hypothetical protein